MSDQLQVTAEILEGLRHLAKRTGIDEQEIGRMAIQWYIDRDKARGQSLEVLADWGLFLERNVLRGELDRRIQVRMWEDWTDDDLIDQIERIQQLWTDRHGTKMPERYEKPEGAPVYLDEENA